MSADAELVGRLRSGDQEAFVALARRYHPTLIRLAATYVPGRAAEDAVQDAWLGMLSGLDGFDGRGLPQDLAVRHPGAPGPFCG